MKYKIACIQLNSSDNVDSNLKAINSYIKKAAKLGAKIIALPENCLFMKAPGVKFEPLQLRKIENAIGTLLLTAKENNIWLLIGSALAKSKKRDKFYNRSYLINNKGMLVAFYDKIHLFDVKLSKNESYLESNNITPGNRAVTIKTPFGILGLSICYDLRFPQLYRVLAKSGAEIIFVPAAFTKKTGEAHWHTLLKARSIENGCYIIAPAQTGLHPGERATYGHSLIIDPWGEIMADGGSKPGIILAEIDLRKVNRIRQILPSLDHDRLFR